MAVARQKTLQPKLLAIISGDVDNQDHPVVLKDTPITNTQAKQSEKNTNHKLPNYMRHQCLLLP